MCVSYKVKNIYKKKNKKKSVKVCRSYDVVSVAYVCGVCSLTSSIRLIHLFSYLPRPPQTDRSENFRLISRSTFDDELRFACPSSSQHGWREPNPALLRCRSLSGSKSLPFHFLALLQLWSFLSASFITDPPGGGGGGGMVWGTLLKRINDRNT